MESQAHWSCPLGKGFGHNLAGESVTARVAPGWSDRKVSLMQHAIDLLIQYPTKVTINAELLTFLDATLVIQRN